MASNDQQSDLFMDLQQLNKQLSNIENEPPFDQWHPTSCGDIDIVITQDGTWLHEGKAITRMGLVKLFAKVLIKEGDEYYLKTPAEKMRIQVEDAPFVITQWQHLSLPNTEDTNLIQVTSNLDHQAILSDEYPLVIKQNNSDEPSLYIVLYRQLTAKIHRNVYYQWADIAQEKQINNQTHFVIQSGEQIFSIGNID